MGIVNKDSSGIGRRIAELRHVNKMTQEYLADILDVSPKHISHVEREVKSLSIQNLIKVSRVFGCSLDYLVFGKHNEKAFEKLPKSIQLILSSNDEEEIARLIRYLTVYEELRSLSRKKPDNDNSSKAL